MKLKMPSFLHDHPVESLFALALLFGLLFVAADGTTSVPAGTQIATSEKN
jgi:hypothetical protein